MDKVTARRLADQYLAEWRDATSYAELAHRDEYDSSDDREVVDGGVAYKVGRTVWREQGDRAYTMMVKVTEAKKRGLFRGSVIRTGRMYPDGRFEDDVR